MKLRAFALLAAAGLVLSGCAADEPKTIVFAGGSLIADTAAFESYRLLIEMIEDDLDVEVEFFEASDRAAIAEGIASGRVDIASIDPYGYVLANTRSKDVEVVAALTRAPEAPAGFYSYGVTSVENTDINSLADIQGEVVCYSDPASTVGYLYPAEALAEAGFDPNPETTDDFEAVFTGIFALQPAIAAFNGDCAVGFVPDGLYNNVLPNIGEVEIDGLKIIWESELISGYALAINRESTGNDLANEFLTMLFAQGNKDYLVEAGYCDSYETCVFTAPQNWGYVEAEDSDFEGIREACNALAIEQCG